MNLCWCHKCCRGADSNCRLLRWEFIVLATRPSWFDMSLLCRIKRLILIKMLLYEFLTQALASKLVKAEDGMQHYAGQNWQQNRLDWVLRCLLTSCTMVKTLFEVFPWFSYGVTAATIAKPQCVFATYVQHNLIIIQNK